MADNLDTILLPENRIDLEALIEAAIARLDDMDGDPDLEPTLGSNAGLSHGGTYWPPEWVAAKTAHLPDECEEVCEDEGAACDDEGAVEQDIGDDEPHSLPWHGSYAPEHQAKVAASCQAAIEGLRAVQGRQGVRS